MSIHKLTVLKNCCQMQAQVNCLCLSIFITKIYGLNISHVSLHIRTNSARATQGLSSWQNTLFINIGQNSVNNLFNHTFCNSPPKTQYLARPQCFAGWKDTWFNMQQWYALSVYTIFITWKETFNYPSKLCNPQ